MKPAIALTPEQGRSRREVVDDLRRLLPRLESVTSGKRVFSFGLPLLDGHLPRGGLASGVLHEITCADDDDMPAALGFVAALLNLMPRAGPVLFVVSPRSLANVGRPHGHGLKDLGLDPARLILVEPENEAQTLWALQEALHSAVPTVVVGAIGKKLDLKMSRRLHLAAGNSGLPLILLLPAGVTGSSAAATRWRIGAAKAARDRFGLVACWRWRARLERCRNGRPGEWLLEFDHGAHRFSLAAPMADLTFSRRPNAQSLATGANRPP
jgi:protein ImuA